MHKKVTTNTKKATAITKMNNCKQIRIVASMKRSSSKHEEEQQHQAKRTITAKKSKNTMCGPSVRPKFAVSVTVLFCF